MIQTTIVIRKKIMSSSPGDKFDIPLIEIDRDKAVHAATDCARYRRKPIIILESPEHILRIQRVESNSEKGNLYDAMDELEIGQSHLFEVPPPAFQRVRLAASLRNKQGRILLSCKSEPSGIRVTRHPLTPEEVAAHGIAQAAPRASKYGLERLEHEAELTFKPADHAELLALRSAVTTKRKHTGWKLVTRTQLDGSVKVHRIKETTQ